MILPVFLFAASTLTAEKRSPTVSREIKIEFAGNVVHSTKTISVGRSEEYSVVTQAGELFTLSLRSFRPVMVESHGVSSAVLMKQGGIIYCSANQIRYQKKPGQKHSYTLLALGKGVVLTNLNLNESEHILFITTGKNILCYDISENPSRGISLHYLTSLSLADSPDRISATQKGTPRIAICSSSNLKSISIYKFDNQRLSLERTLSVDDDLCELRYSPSGQHLCYSTTNGNLVYIDSATMSRKVHGFGYQPRFDVSDTGDIISCSKDVTPRIVYYKIGGDIHSLQSKTVEAWPEDIKFVRSGVAILTNRIGSLYYLRL